MIIINQISAADKYRVFSLKKKDFAITTKASSSFKKISYYVDPIMFTLNHK